MPSFIAELADVLSDDDSKLLDFVVAAYLEDFTGVPEAHISLNLFDYDPGAATPRLSSLVRLGLLRFEARHYTPTLVGLMLWDPAVGGVVRLFRDLFRTRLKTEKYPSAITWDDFVEQGYGIEDIKLILATLRLSRLHGSASWGTEEAGWTDFRAGMPGAAERIAVCNTLDAILGELGISADAYEDSQEDDAPGTLPPGESALATVASTGALSPEHRANLRRIIVDAFRREELDRLVQDVLGKRLETVVRSSQTLEADVSDVVDFAARHGQLAGLLSGLQVRRPDRPEVQDYLREIGFSAEVAGATGLEAIVGGNTLFVSPSQWRSMLASRERQVCRVECRGVERGTGFLVGPDLVLTAFHVVETLEDRSVSDWSVRFDYRNALDGLAVSSGTSVALTALVDHTRPSAHEATLSAGEPDEPEADELDFALLRIETAIGDEALDGSTRTRGWISLRDSPVDLLSVPAIAIIQHPQGQPLRLAQCVPARLRLNGRGNRVLHSAPTLAGSSGSPVFDGDWNLIAIHQARDPHQATARYNQAIPISLIANRPLVAEATTRRWEKSR